MASHFNALSPAEAERLAILIEEMGEAAQIAAKILRHGYESHNPFDPAEVSNRHLLETELGHVRHAMIRLCDANDLRKSAIHWHAEQKSDAIRQWLHHQDEGRA